MNLKKVIAMVLLSFGIMASVNASYTDALKQKYADGSFYIEYQVTRQDKNGEISKHQKPSIWSPSKTHEKYIYAQKGDSKYYQRNDFVIQKEKVGGYGNKLPKDYFDRYRENVIASMQMEPLSYGSYYNHSLSKINNEDINLVKDGKIYALDRFNVSGYWTTAEKINENRLWHKLCA